MGDAMQAGGAAAAAAGDPSSAAAAAAAAVAAAGDRSGVAGRFEAYPTLWSYYDALFPPAQMLPTVVQWRGREAWHEVLHQVPPNPRGTVFFAHGCAHAARDFWPPSPACPDCLGLPEEMAQAQQALARGYAGAPPAAAAAAAAAGGRCLRVPSHQQRPGAALRWPPALHAPPDGLPTCRPPAPQCWP